jgi:hypothetical protein
MKKSLCYLLVMGIAILISSSTPKPFNQQENFKSISPLGSGYCTIYNQSVNTITSIVVQQIYSPGNSVSTTYNSPSFPLQVPVNGTVTIIVHFAHSGPDGNIILYQEDPSGGWTFIDSESYDPSYLSPISFVCGDAPNYTVYYELFITNN